MQTIVMTAPDRPPRPNSQVEGAGNFGSSRICFGTEWLQNGQQQQAVQCGPDVIQFNLLKTIKLN
jgi:hypothetical protein